MADREPLGLSGGSWDEIDDSGDNLLVATGVGLKIADGTPSAVPFYSTGGLVSQDSANFAFDNTKKVLKVNGAEVSPSLKYLMATSLS